MQPKEESSYQALEMKTRAYVFLYFATAPLLLSAMTDGAPVAMFVFGDSLVDTGNNNHIPSIARANFPPNGIDYPTHKATGRFCNGKIISDLLSDFMGTPPILPYLDPSNDDNSLLLGSNFASAGAGILNSTGRIFVALLTIEQQFQYFRDYQQKITAILGPAGAQKLVSEALYSVTLGGNDYINNYLMPFSKEKKQYTLPQFQDLLITEYKKELTELYNMGARKISISALGPLGCIPSQLSMKSKDGTCVALLQEVASNFNAALKVMTEQLNSELSGVTFVYANSFDMVFGYIQNPSTYGFVSSNTACCGQGKYNGVLVCNPASTVCPDRSKYIFWDPFHPTERVNRMITERLLNGPPSDISPVNVRQLLGI